MILLICALVAFFSTLFITPRFSKFLRAIGAVGIDVHKRDKRKVPEMGGPVVLFGFLAGSFLFLWAQVFLFGRREVVDVLAVISTALITTLIGMIDDLGVLLKKREGFKRIGLKQWQKPLLTLPAAVPLMAIMAGNPNISLPFIGSVNVGLLYPLFLVPIGIVGATNAYNLLGGLNGVEAGMGFVILVSLGVFALNIGEIDAGAIALISAFSVLAFLYYNWYPAKIFPGDSFTYLIGSLVASVAIIGNFEKFAVFCFIPWIIEFFLKARTKFKAQCFGELQEDGTLRPKEGIKSLTHLFMRNLREWEVSLCLVGLELFTCLLAFSLYYWGLL
ncbi:MAG: UDP-N-acetylglucosamine--dolichyl-phosphate N-acetylglucosaminephosphotransferase [Nanoarchaeota archaeon]|nr:UDP-N-acetylglucosamine--dolichyl-phosphate N-acetylglucosaminephosphotransferase [Nanoarchaeota archaeon]